MEFCNTDIWTNNCNHLSAESVELWTEAAQVFTQISERDPFARHVVRAEPPGFSGWSSLTVERVWDNKQCMETTILIVIFPCCIQWLRPVSLVLRKLKQEDHKFEALLVFIMTPCLQKENIDLEIRIMDTHSHKKEKKRWGRVEGAGQMVQWLST